MILKGTPAAATEARPTPCTMPAQGWTLDERQVAAASTYVRNARGNVGPPVTARQVESVRRKIDREIALRNHQKADIPANAGIHAYQTVAEALDPSVRWDDDSEV